MVLAVFEVTIGSVVGALLEKSNKVTSAKAMVTLKNGSIALASLVIFCVFNKIISPSSAWFVFWSFTILSSCALFGTVGLKTVVNRDMMVDLTAGDELTVLNSKMMAIDR